MFLINLKKRTDSGILLKSNKILILTFPATDKWGFTPLHEAAQKGRTQLCSLLLAHGADPSLKNQEGQTPLDLSTAEDVKCLLQDAMTTTVASLPTTSKSSALPVDHQQPLSVTPIPRPNISGAAQMNNPFPVPPGILGRIHVTLLITIVNF